ncbi:hypothetical protein L1049_009583 [Liquidambar formosana]|uniref:Cystatin domain-containing protein n=1 Tax=Liquidambar formosana TaxID=63359 RepID=A0AAP0R450_LIQFO
MRPRYCLLLLASFLLFNGVSSAVMGGRRREGRVGGWWPIKDVNDPGVQTVGLFAVTEYNKEAKKRLKLKWVVKGETQVMTGTHYRLILAAAMDGAVSNNFEAVVLEVPWEYRWNLASLDLFKSVM